VRPLFLRSPPIGKRFLHILLRPVSTLEVFFTLFGCFLFHGFLFSLFFSSYLIPVVALGLFCEHFLSATTIVDWVFLFDWLGTFVLFSNSLVEECRFGVVCVAIGIAVRLTVD